MFHVHLKICEFCCWMECCINNNLVRLVDSSFQIFYMLTSLFKFRKYLTIISKYVRFPSLMLPHFFRYFSCMYVRPLNIVTQATEAWLVSNFFNFFFLPSFGLGNFYGNVFKVTNLFFCRI